MAGVQTRWPAAPERGGLPHRGTLPHSNTGPQSYTQGHSAATVSLDLQFQPQSLGMCHSRSDSLKESQRHILHKICTGSKSYDMINNPQGWTTTKLSPTNLLKQKRLVKKKSHICTQSLSEDKSGTKASEHEKQWPSKFLQPHLCRSIFHKDCINKYAANHFNATSNTSCLSLGTSLGQDKVPVKAVAEISF